MPTPLLKIEQNIVPSVIYVKLEGANPTGSVKDRFAEYVMKNERMLRPGMTIIEVSAGSTAAALAHKAKMNGFKSRFLVPDNAYEETLQRLKELKVDCILDSFPINDGPFKPIDTIEALCQEDNYFWTKQYYRDDSQAIYASLTAEIEKQVSDSIAFYAAACGTGGTVIGTAKNLRKANPDLEVIAAFSSPESFISGIRPLGITTSYKHYKDIFDPNFPNMNAIGVSKEKAEKGLEILKENNVIAGISGGAALYALLSVLENKKHIPKNHCAVIVLADGKPS